ncbi:hypothetical protein O7599_25470 [Streptomyces sp. WMMC500]|uniref:hypothetical protein n=1 Tax=Streptomyces sp. WMMC500 TaxID=3015154 RepID=UPI00248D2AA3|nr:hypothetical protein [Streptomyces sp. WMMC500]WBB58941.1 hypothetical protein O7599_25470 [Streptomyces sp. WMMC500]
MSATTFAVLLAAAAPAVLLGVAVLRAVSGLRREVVTLRAELTAQTAARGAGERARAVPESKTETAAAETAAETQTDAAEGQHGADGTAVPAARPVPAAEIRIAVAQALADERERELAEARAFWAEQEARDSIDATPFPGDPVDFGGEVFIPRQTDFAGFEPLLDPMDRLDRMDRLERMEGGEPADPADTAAAEAPPAEGESAELAAARRRHPSHPDFRPQPAVADQERTVNRLEDLAAGRTPLTDVRLGPLGTLDVYVFADGTTLCLSPGHRDTAERLAEALDGGTEPVLLGGSAISGAFALTFDCAGESVYILADRVIASL